MLLKDLVQNTLKDERLKFVEKQKARLEGEYDPKVDETLFVEPVDVFMMDVTDSTKGLGHDYEEQMEVVFPKAKKELIDFLNRCKLKDLEVILCPCYITFFVREAEKEMEKTNPGQSKRVGRRDQHQEFF